MVTAGDAEQIVMHAKQHIYTIRPIAEWHPMKAGTHRSSGEFAVDVLALLPGFLIRFPGVLEATRIVCKRPVSADCITEWLGRPSDITHEVSYACWITSEFGPSTVHLVVFALACCRGICSDRVVILLSICVVAVA